jgi:hypothetical protein
LVYFVYLVHLGSSVQPNKRDKPNKPEQPAGCRASRVTASFAGGGFEHMLVEIDHA